MIEIGVIVATRNRADYLTRCLRSLCEQTLAKDQFEVCVVNNGSTDHTRAAFAKMQSEYRDHRLFMVDEVRLGVSRARNRGLSATAAPLVAFIDDDAVACTTWLQDYVARFASLGQEVANIYGDIEPEFEAALPDWITDPMLMYLSARTFKPATPHYVDQSAVECNVCYRRSSLVGAGGFPEQLGRIGNNLLSGEGAVDYLIRATGAKTFYDPAIVVRHTIHADRVRPDWIRRRFFWQGVTDFKIRQYLRSRGFVVNEPPKVDAPTSYADWSFVNDSNSTENIGVVVHKMYAVGFLLAASGILQID